MLEAGETRFGSEVAAEAAAVSRFRHPSVYVSEGDESLRKAVALDGDLDIDLAVESIEHPEKYPLVSRG